MIITGKTRVVGIIGNPIEHSLSPVMQNAAFERLGLNWCYLPFLVVKEQVGAAVEAVRALNLVGINVTMPFKEAVIPFLDEVTKEAGFVQAVNTIHQAHGRLTGYNTDGEGFVRSLKDDASFETAGATVFLLGAGGAARAIANSLAKYGVSSVTILNRTVDSAIEFSQGLKKRFPHLETNPRSFKNEFYSLLKDADIVINATPLGRVSMKEMPISAGNLTPGQFVCDLATSPKTAFLEAARERGCRTLDGLGMLVYQGAAAFKIWTGLDAPVEVMWEATRRAAKNE